MLNSPLRKLQNILFAKESLKPVTSLERKLNVVTFLRTCTVFKPNVNKQRIVSQLMRVSWQVGVIVLQAVRNIMVGKTSLLRKTSVNFFNSGLMLSAPLPDKSYSSFNAFESVTSQLSFCYLKFKVRFKISWWPESINICCGAQLTRWH